MLRQGLRLIAAGRDGMMRENGITVRELPE